MYERKMPPSPKNEVDALRQGNDAATKRIIINTKA